MFKKYLLLKVEGGIILEKCYKYKELNGSIKIPREEREELEEIIKKEGVPLNCIWRGGNLRNPIPYTTLSNVLISLANGTPVPTNEKRRNELNCNFSRPKCCDDAALSSYYHLDSPVDPFGYYVKQVVGIHGNVYSIMKPGPVFPNNMFWDKKRMLNSNRTGVSTTLYIDDNGKPLTVKGSANFNMLLRHFNDDVDNPVYKRVIEFISELLRVDDVRKHYYFHYDEGVDENLVMCKKLHELQKYDWYRKKVEDFYNEMKPLWGNAQNWWFYVMFGYGEKTSSGNTDSKQNSTIKTYLHNQHGVDKSNVIVKGHIIVPITDERLYNALMNGRGACRFLDEGICMIVNATDRPEVFDYEKTWAKIS